ncbi:MAG: hypothetical protein AAB847_00525 [Patescibacteria group bacterium]
MVKFFTIFFIIGALFFIQVNAQRLQNPISLRDYKRCVVLKNTCLQQANSCGNNYFHGACRSSYQECLGNDIPAPKPKYGSCEAQLNSCNNKANRCVINSDLLDICSGFYNSCVLKRGDFKGIIKLFKKMEKAREQRMIDHLNQEL